MTVNAMVPVVTTTGSQAPTNKDLTGSGNTFPTLNQNTTGTAAAVGTVFGPADYGFIGWSFAPEFSTTSGAAVTGAQLGVAVKIPVATTISNITVYVGVAGATLTASQCFLGLYSGAGALLSATADQSTAWLSTGYKTAALTTPQAVSAGIVQVSFLANGTTMPQFGMCPQGTGTAGPGAVLPLSGGIARCGSTNFGRTTLNPTLGGYGFNGFWFWAAVS